MTIAVTGHRRATAAGQTSQSSQEVSVLMGGCVVDLRELDEVVDAVVDRAAAPHIAPLAVVSANLDHVEHFGTRGRWNGVLEHAERTGEVELLTLLDGMPLVSEAGRLTGRPWPRLAGSDLIDPILDKAEERGVRVGFLGGSEETQRELRTNLALTRPRLRVTGWWSPPREVLTDHSRARGLALEVAAAGVDLLVVGLGKPRQELWIAEHGRHTGAGALLAFGAVVDFLAGRIPRAPQWVADAGLEWSFRLAHEPRRLSRRYLVDGPAAYGTLRFGRSPVPRRTTGRVAVPNPRRHQDENASAPADVSEAADVSDLTVIVVTHNSAAHLPALLDDLARDRGALDLRVLVVDNASTDETVAVARSCADIVRRPGFNVAVLRSPGNLGYAGGINVAFERLARTSAVLVLNPDLRLSAGSLEAMWRRLWQHGVGAVAPRLLDTDGRVFPSLRFEPSPARAVGDALLGARLPMRPTWATETDRNPESYVHAHPIDWATGACLMFRSEVVQAVGRWDERYFLYSEEVDYLRRTREAGWPVWFEPQAEALHVGGGSGRSDLLAALECVNRVRYAEAVAGPTAARLTRAAAVTGAILRAPLAPSHRATARFLLQRHRWASLPAAQVSYAIPPAPGNPIGAVVVPACNESAVIERALAPLGALGSTGHIEVVVVVNGSTDDTAELARDVDGVRVLEIDVASKPAALNAADDVSSAWPRLYLDADIEITPRAVLDVLERVSRGDVLAARPPYRYDTSGASWLVRAFYDARSRLGHLDDHLWGAGAYALSEAGHARLGVFPDLLADDLLVDVTFAPDEKTVVETDPVVVSTPRTVTALLAVLRRTSRGNAEIAASRIRTTTWETVAQLMQTVRGPLSAAHALAYASLVLAGRGMARRGGARWDRDDSSRTLVQDPTA